MRLEGPAVPERPGELRACMVVRNEVLRLASVLDHHRALGVDRFLIVDDGSTDGTRELLAAQPDVHILRGEGSHLAAGCGLAWINAVLDEFCDDQWVLTIDADELFVFPGCERIGLRALCAHLDARAVRGLFALLLDMYGPGDITESVHAPGGSLIETCPWFDPGPYEPLRAGPFPHVQFTGGVRARIFDFSPYQPRPPVLSKVPLVRWRRGARYLLSTHAITRTPLSGLVAAVLHFKFLSDFPARVDVAVEEGQHYGASQEYRAYQNRLRSAEGLVLRDARSVRYEGSRQLVELGLMRTDAAFDSFLAGA